MPDWGEIFAAPEMQLLAPNPEVLALLPFLKSAGCRRVLDAGCGVGRHLLPLTEQGFQVWGVDREATVIKVLKTRLAAAAARAYLTQADLRRLPFPAGVFHLVLSINVINHGDTKAFHEYCRELDRVLKAGGHLFVYVSPREFADRVRLPQTRKLEPDTFVDIATPDGNLVHHFPTPEELRAQFPLYQVKRGETVLAPIPFMDQVKLPQLILWAQKYG